MIPDAPGPHAMQGSREHRVVPAGPKPEPELLVVADAAKLLRRLLPLKSRAEYDPAPVTTADANRAVESATRLVELARSTV